MNLKCLLARFWSRIGLASTIDLKEMEQRMAQTQAEAAAEVRNLTAKINKIGTETATTLQKVKDLEAIIVAGGEVTPELRTALDEAIAAAQTADDLTPDAPTPPPV